MERRVTRFPLLLPEGEAYQYEVENLTKCSTNTEDLRYWAEHFLLASTSVTRYALEANHFLRASGAAALPEGAAQQAATRFVLEWERWSAGLQVRLFISVIFRKYITNIWRVFGW
jgi:hypothetical protein